MKVINTMQGKKKQGGFVLTTELVLISTVLIIGLITGLVTMRDSLTAEMDDVAEAVGHFDQSYAYNGIINGENTAGIAGSVFGDATDTFAGDDAEFTFVAATGVEGAGAAADSLGASSAAEAGTITTAQ